MILSLLPLLPVIKGANKALLSLLAPSIEFSGYISLIIKNMRYQHLNSIHPLITDYLHKHIQPGNTVIDATLGNGYDTLKIAELLLGQGKIYGFDIQPLAIESSQQLLSSLPAPKPIIHLIEDSHANFAQYIQEEVDFIIYNLGYLPKGNKAITTLAESTLQSVKSGLALLKANGIMLIAVYHGHDAGKSEKATLESYLSTLDQKYFNVLKQQFINQKNTPPFIYVIEKANNTVE